MRLATARTSDAPSGTTAVRLDGDEAVRLPFADVAAVLASGVGPDELARMDGPHSAGSELDLAPVVPRPNKIVCLGLNYASHIAEMGRAVPAHPTLFAKYDGALIGPRDRIVLPRVSDQVDWEAELAVVIGRAGRYIERARALEHVGGYCVLNDVTARDWQHRTREFLSGKTFESTTPAGPVLVTPDELPPGAAGLAVECRVDGELMQSAQTGDLLFDVAAIIAYVSEIITLVPGDLIATGTPGGVGAGRTPPVFLRPGQRLRTWIEGIGELDNLCVTELEMERAGHPVHPACVEERR